MNNYQAKTEAFLSRKLARKIKNVIGGGGWVNQKEFTAQAQDPAVFEICVYHPNIKEKVSDMFTSEVGWKIKNK